MFTKIKKRHVRRVRFGAVRAQVLKSTACWSMIPCNVVKVY